MSNENLGVEPTNCPLVRADLGMTENAFRTFREILLTGEYGINALDFIEIVMQYERRTGVRVPDYWLRD